MNIWNEWAQKPLNTMMLQEKVSENDDKAGT